MTHKAQLLIDMLHEELHNGMIENDIPGLNEGLKALVNLQSELNNRQPNPCNFDDLYEKVIQWGVDKGILDKADAKAQMLKCMAEVGELADGVAKGDIDEIIDGVGDVMVTLILLCNIKEINLTYCLKTAYEEIKNRKGIMQDGVFVKQTSV